MNFAKRMLMVAGAGALAGILAIAIAPKTAHALVAALVQVSNTPSSAVPVMYAPAASNVYFASCEGFFSGGSLGSCTMPPTPADRTLVIEAASILTQTAPGVDPSYGFLNTSSQGPVFVIPMQRQSPFGGVDSYAGQLQGRITIPAITSDGLTPSCGVALGQNSSFGELFCAISGYTIPAN
jgi:hypothetical protein